LGSKSFSQKIIEKELDATLYNNIEISSDEIHHINLISTNLNTISINIRIEGKDHENIVLSLLEKNKTLFIEPDTTPFFKSINDKLAAHKVQSIEIELKIPKRFGISVISKTAKLVTTFLTQFIPVIGKVHLFKILLSPIRLVCIIATIIF